VSTAAVEASRASKFRHALAAGWGAVSGVAPHVLHHVGPLAGAAILAGTGGRILFFGIGLAVAMPMLMGLYRRFDTWAAPAVAVAVFAATYSVSSLFLGPLLTGNQEASLQTPPVTTIHGHDH